MKQHLLIATGTLLAAGLATSANAAILVDYDDGDNGNGVHDASIRNGGFEENVIGGSTVHPGNTLSFANTNNWYNVGTGLQSGEAISNSANFDDLSPQTGVLAESLTRVFGMDTGHTLSTGEEINFSLWWRDAFNWDDGLDQVTFNIFTTVDDTIDGAVDEKLTSVAPLSTSNNTFEEFSGMLTANGAMDGKNLFISIDNINGNATEGFVRLDNVFVEVVPEPGSLALLGLGGLLIARRRRA